MVYFMIGTNILGKDANTTWQVIQNQVFKGGMGGPTAEGQQINPQIDSFKLGNLDTLLHTAEQMQKLESQVEGLLRKIERQYLDITDESTVSFKIDTTDTSYTVEQFLYKFKWADKQFPRSVPLPELVASLQKRMNLIDTDFRQKANAYQEKKNVQQSLQSKEGNLYIRDLADVLNPQIVREKDFHYTDYITSVVAVVPKNKINDFLQKYELVTENVLPSSAKQFNIEDKDQLTLFRILLYKQELVPVNMEEMTEKQKRQYKAPVENFIYKMREELGITVREFHYSKNMFDKKEEARNQISKEAKDVTGLLTKSCKIFFSDLYHTYAHLKYLRMVVDIASRFGQREPALTAIIKPGQGKEKKTITDLMKLFCEPNQMGMYGTKEELEDTEDFYPFVYIPINVI